MLNVNISSLTPLCLCVCCVSVCVWIRDASLGGRLKSNNIIIIRGVRLYNNNNNKRGQA